MAARLPPGAAETVHNALWRCNRSKMRNKKKLAKTDYFAKVFDELSMSMCTLKVHIYASNFVRFLF